jgi:hypothetical protein
MVHFQPHNISLRIRARVTIMSSAFIGIKNVQGFFLSNLGT